MVAGRELLLTYLNGHRALIWQSDSTVAIFERVAAKDTQNPIAFWTSAGKSTAGL